MVKNTIYNLATDIANIPPMRMAERIRFRRLIFKAIAISIEAAKNDPSLLETIENWAEVQG